LIYNEKYNQYSDLELIAEYKNTENKLFIGILYKRYSHLVLGLSLKYLKNEDEAKDAVMQIFEKLFADLLKHQIEFFKSWLYTYSKNFCLMIIRTRQSKLKKEIELENNADLFMETESGLHLNKADEKEKQFVALENAINELKDEQKKCIDLFYLKEKSYVEIAEMTGFSINEVKSYIQNGKRNLKIKLENKLGKEQS
jgi:RNA polymerase sigma-70 factor (ECF subfamily)